MNWLRKILWCFLSVDLRARDFLEKLVNTQALRITALENENERLLRQVADTRLHFSGVAAGRLPNNLVGGITP